MADYYLKSWSNGIGAEAQTAGEPAESVYKINLADTTAISATLVNGDKIHFAQVSGNKKPFLQAMKAVIEAAVPNSTFSVCYTADSTEVVVFAIPAFTTGTAVLASPAIADYLVDAGLAVTDSVHDYYLKVIATPGASPTGSIWLYFPIVPNTGVAPANNQ